MASIPCTIEHEKLQTLTPNYGAHFGVPEQLCRTIHGAPSCAWVPLAVLAFLIYPEPNATPGTHASDGGSIWGPAFGVPYNFEAAILADALGLPRKELP